MVFTIEFIVFLCCTLAFLDVSCILTLSLFLLGYCFLEQVMDSLSSPASTVPSFHDRTQHVDSPFGIASL